MSYLPWDWSLWTWCFVSGVTLFVLGGVCVVASYRIFRRYLRIGEAVEALGEPWPYQREMFNDGDEFLWAARKKVERV